MHGCPAEQEVAVKRGMHRAHSSLKNPPLAVEPVTRGARRHHISPNGFYRGKKVVTTKADE
jgi:large subunit ribosomal protein L32